MSKESTKELNLRRHHWLVSGKVTFIRGDDPNANSFEHNTAITNTKQFVTGRMIGEAQQMIQMHLFEQCPDPTMKVLNVHIQAVSYLGCMTKEEFYTPPPAEEAAPAGEPEAEDIGKPDPFANKVH